jgi:hypothetical protein
MHLNFRSRFLQRTLAFGALPLAAACDAQVGPGYFGEALLTITGSVEIASDPSREPLLPALAFRGDAGDSITIVDVSVRGSFPSDFQLDVYESPPESALHHPTYQVEGEPRVAIGYITAVNREHPDILYWGNSHVAELHDGCIDEGRADNLCWTQTLKDCVLSKPEVACYEQKYYCPDETSPPEDCVIETSGDPLLSAENILDYFGGFSENYQVVYLEDEAPVGSATAAWFGAKDGLPAGYSLFEVRLTRRAEQTCQDDTAAWQLATERYNAEHGTSYARLDCQGLDDDPPYCTELILEDNFQGRLGMQGDVNRFVERAKMDLGCALNFVAYTRVAAPESTSISVVIGAEPPRNL